MAQPSSRLADLPQTANNKVLFWASFLTLIAAGMGFALRNTTVKAQWGNQFGFTQTELGDISGGGLAGFGITIIVLSFVADKIGYRRLMGLAFFFHLSSAIVTLSASLAFQKFGRDGAYYCLSIGMWLFAFGNGTCEAVINPLTATLYPNNKTHWLNILHAGWPAGLVLGSLTNIVLDKTAGPGLEWEFRLAIFIVPVLIYGILMLPRPFPSSEANVSGVTLGTMLAQFLAPILLFLILIQAMVGFVELGTDSWISNVTSTILSNQTYGTLLFIWTSLMMFTLRFFAGPIVHKISPLGLLFVSAILAACGLTLLGNASGITMCIVAATIYGFGKTFFWPTMLGVVSERYPRGGALTMGMVGGIGMLSAGLLGDPGIGYEQDYFTTQKLQSTAPEAYVRYKSDTEIGFPFVTPLVKDVTGQDMVPKIAGLDNAKVGVLEEYMGHQDRIHELEKQIDAAKQQNQDASKLEKDLAEAKAKKLTLESDIDILTKTGRTNDKLNQQYQWWETNGKPYAAEDVKTVTEARLTGAKAALRTTAAVPAAMAICYLILIFVFWTKGGYKQIHIDDPHGGMSLEATPR